MVSVAGAVSSWYWSIDKTKTPSHALLDAWVRACRYNLGSIAAASFMVCIFSPIRMFLEYFTRKTRELQSRWICIEIIYKIIRMIILSFEVLLHLVSKNAFIVIGMCGTSFMTSAGEATTLIYHHSTSVPNVNVGAQLVLYLGKILVCLISCLSLFAHMEGEPSYQKLGINQLNSEIAPLVLCFILAFIISSAFFYMYDTVMDTLLMCYCYDMVHVEGEHFYGKRIKSRIDAYQENRLRNNGKYYSSPGSPSNITQGADDLEGVTESDALSPSKLTKDGYEGLTLRSTESFEVHVEDGANPIAATVAVNEDPFADDDKDEEVPNGAPTVRKNIETNM
jgi:hypothetical protein